jgi:hypothetical protein
MRQQTLPATIPGRLTLVGHTLYGRSFKAKLAAGLNVSRSTLFEWMRGGGKRRDIDNQLIALLDDERDAADERSIEIAALRKTFAAARHD